MVCNFQSFSSFDQIRSDKIRPEKEKDKEKDKEKETMNKLLTMMFIRPRHTTLKFVATIR
jgi:hypothetical protein